MNTKRAAMLLFSDCKQTKFYKRKGSENEEFSEFNPQAEIALFAEENSSAPQR